MNKLKLLIIDDEKSFTVPWKEILEETNLFEITVEDYGCMAIEKLRDCRPDIVIIDRLLLNDLHTEINRSDGFIIANVIRKEREFDGIPIIHWTATCDIDEATKLTEEERGMGIYYLSKADSDLRTMSFFPCVLL